MVIVDRSYDPCNCIAAYAGGRIMVNRDPWHQRKTQNIHIVFVLILFSENTNNLVRKTKSRPGVLLKFLQDAREGSRVEKVKLLIKYHGRVWVFVGCEFQNRVRPWEPMQTHIFLISTRPSFQPAPIYPRLVRIVWVSGECGYPAQPHDSHNLCSWIWSL